MTGTAPVAWPIPSAWGLLRPRAAAVYLAPEVMTNEQARRAVVADLREQGWTRLAFRHLDGHPVSVMPGHPYAVVGMPPPSARAARAAIRRQLRDL